MLRSLYSKFAAVLMILFIIVGIFALAVIFFATDMYHQEVNQKLNRNLARNIVAEKLLIQDKRINHAALEEVFHMLMVINPAIELYLLDPEGKIMAFSADPGKVKRQHINLAPVRQWLADDPAIPLLGEDPRDPGRQKVFSAAPIPSSGKPEGYLYIILGGEDYDNIAQKIQSSYILKLSSRLIGAGLVFALVAGLLVFALLTGRLKKLAAAMDAFTKGKPLSSIELLPVNKQAGHGDEIDHFSLTFRDMAARIEEQIDRLQQSDLLRRELVANVSHDLRTPLATLTAYIETLVLKEGDLNTEERRNYLKIAGKHCERLNTLVSDLFELARLDAEESHLQQESFSIAELVQDVVQNYELTANDQQLNLITNIGQEVPFVFADIGLVQRVLENLITNAMRHTPKDGTVSIILTPEKDSVKIQVLDTGSGIPQDALPHIFKRFYKISASGSHHPSYAGLGLAITKRILELHGSDIEVQSELHAGTCFTFRLPVHTTG